MTPLDVGRVDWRFLLPGATTGAPLREHALVIGGPRDVVALMREVRVAARVSGSVVEAAGDTGPDLLVLLRGSESSRREGIEALRPGGIAYIETAQRRGLHSLASPGRMLRSRAARNGLDFIAAYGVWPAFDQPTVWLPLVVSGALQWYARTMQSLRTPWEQWVARMLAGRGGASVLGWPLVTKSFAVVARKPGGGSAYVEDVHDDIVWSAMICHGAERVVLMPFGTDGGPREVRKVARQPRFNSKNEAEHAALRRLRQSLPAELGGALPEPRGLHQRGDVTIACQEYIPGRPVVYELAAWHAHDGMIRDIARDASEWLAGFQAHVATERGPLGGARLRDWFAAPTERLARVPAMAAVAGPLAARIRDALGALHGLPVPTVIRHRDYTPWNLIRRPDGLKVLDWEGAGPGAPLEDLVHFLTAWHEMSARARDDGARRRAVVALYCGPAAAGSLASHARACLLEYARRLGLDTRWIPVFIGQTFITLAARYSSSLEPAAGDVPDVVPELPLLDGLARHRDALFATWRDPVAT